MTCDEAREIIGADPAAASPELLAHLEKCPQCQAYREQMRALNAKIQRALELDWQKPQGSGTPPIAPWVAEPPVAAQPAAAPAAAPTASAAPARPAARPAPGQQPVAPPPADRSNVVALRRKPRAPVAKHRSPKLFAFAASVAAALLVGFTLWLSRPPESLAAEIVTHVKGEPDSWHRTQPLAAEQLDAVLRKSGVRLGPGMQPVVYASSCWFRGHFVPHFVVMTQDGPVTVMILVNEKVPAAQQFNEEGYSGLLVPARTGSVAVLSRTPMPLEQPASHVVKALQSAD
jgi:Protein of unknown function (DUF3379)